MKKITTILTCFIIHSSLIAQDLNFSQFYMLPLLRNPGIAGVFEGDLRISGAYRNQWQSVTTPFRSGAMSVEYKIPFFWDDFITVGLQATHDIAGDIKLKRTQLLPVINYHKSLSGEVDDYLSLGFMAGPVQSQFDPTKLRMNDQYQNGMYNPGNPTSQVFQRTGFSYWDASVGMSFSSGFGYDARYYVGAAVFHFNKPKVAFYTSNSNVSLDPKYVLNFGLTTPTSDLNDVRFFADIFKQGGHTEVVGGLFYSIELDRDYETELSTAIEFGSMYRWNDAVIPSVKLDYRQLAIGISYDVNVSKLKSASQLRGGFEITAVFKAKMTSRNYYTKRFRCLKFE